MGGDDKEVAQQKQVERFYALLKSIMDVLFRSTKSRHVKIPDASFGLIYDKRDSVLFSGTI